MPEKAISPAFSISPQSSLTLLFEKRILFSSSVRPGAASVHFNSMNRTEYREVGMRKLTVFNFITEESYPSDTRPHVGS